VLHTYLIYFLVSALLSFILTQCVRNFAIAREWVDVPGVDRHLHTNPVPRLGGVAIFLSFTIMVGGTLAAPKLLNLSAPFSVRTTLAMLGPALIVFLMGVYDDVRSLGPYWKFGIQSFAAVLLYFGGIGIHRLELLSAGRALHIAIGLPLTILWVLLITNAFNLIDGLDGLAAGSALFSTMTIFVISLLRGNQLVSFLTIVLAGTILAFLRYNFNPATIFLGDSGSQFIGFMLSALALAGSQKATTIVAIAIPVVSFGLPIFDVALAVVRRFLRGKPLFSGDDEHVHHKLLKLGLSQRKTVIILYAVTAGFGLLSVALLHGEGMIALVLAIIGIGVWLGVQELRYEEFFELQDLIQRAMRRKRIIANNLNIRRATESLNSSADLWMICQILEDALQPLGFDGVHFRSTSADSLPESFFAPLHRDPDGSLRCCWADVQASEPAWELKLELITSSGHKWGYFSLFRSCAEELLFVDLNLVTAEFRTALSDALHRAMSGSQAIPRDLEHKEMDAARATSTF